MRTLFFIFSSFILLMSCKNETSSDPGTQANEETVPVKSSTVSTVPSKYLIVPPDSDYTGDYVDKYNSGVIKFSGFFRFGERHGQWMAFYENGVMWSECFYDKGKRDGLSRVYYPTGKTQYTGWFKNDLQDSVWVYYNEEGNVVERRAYKKGQEVAVPN